MRKPVSEVVKRNPIGEKIEDFELLGKVGSGGFGEVFKARSLRPGYEDFYYAIKRINKEYIYKKGYEQRIENEIEIHSGLSHPAVVKFETSFEDEEFWYLVLEFCGRGSFEEFIKCKGHLSEEEACQLIKQVFDGVQYLHLKHVLHRDLSLRNILLMENGDVKIADFGLADKCHPNEKKTSMLGTPNFMPPEVVMRYPYDFKADIWSVGCVLYALLYSAPPFNDKKKNSTMKDVVKSELKFPGYASKEAMELLKDMLKKDPKDRIEIKNALQHAFFQKYQKAGKEYESSSRKSADSGMSSLSSSTSGSSRSGRKTKETSDRSVKNIYKNAYCGHSNPVGNTSSRTQEDNGLRIGRQRATPPSKPKLKKNVPDSVNQLKNKIQPLPSRQEVYDIGLSKHIYPKTREYNYKEKQEWEVRNELNIDRRDFNHDDVLESQFDDPVRSRPETPLYPPHLHNLGEENLKMNSHFSCYNDVGSSKNYESICKQNSCITRANSQDNMTKCSSCSHDQYCPPENNCLHKSSCCCHQSPVYIPKNKSNSICHHSYEEETRQDLEIRNSIEDKNLKDILTPLTTVRLQPKRHTTKNAIVSILNDGQVCVEFLKLKGKKNCLAYVCFISQDGLNITVYKPKKKILPSDKPPPLPVSIQEVQYFSFENLPETHWKKYQYAKRFVDIVKAKTPKVTIYGKDAKCVMMENTPNPDYEVNFFNGFQITEVGAKITITDQNDIQLTGKNNYGVDTEFLLEVFASMKEKCKTLEAYLENLSKACSIVADTCFPVIFGRRPNALLRNLDDNKENASPRSMHSSTLNGTVTGMKSYSGTINTDCSPCTKSPQADVPSPLSNGKTATQFRNISEILPDLKGQPLVVKGWVIAEYKDDIQMWISMNDQDVFFLDIHTKQRLPNNEHPELMKRFDYDLRSVLSYALSEEVKKTK